MKTDLKPMSADDELLTFADHTQVLVPCGFFFRPHVWGKWQALEKYDRVWECATSGVQGQNPCSCGLKGEASPRS